MYHFCICLDYKINIQNFINYVSADKDVSPVELLNVKQSYNLIHYMNLNNQYIQHFAQ